MKALKIYLAVVTVLLIIALGFGVYVWMTIQKLQNVSVSEIAEPTTIETVQDAQGKSSEEKSESVPTTPPTEKPQEPVNIEVNKLSDTQQEILKTFGVKSDTLTITPTMITCAEEKLGAPRVAEITNGAAPSPFEAVSLAGCFK